MKLIAEFSDTQEGTSRVFWNDEWEEFVVRWYNTDGVHMDASDYHTTDETDALETAELSLEREDTLHLY